MPAPLDRRASGQPPPSARPRTVAEPSDSAEDAEGIYGRRLRLPATIPGAQAAHIHLPSADFPDLLNEVVAELFPDLPKTPSLALPRSSPERPAMDLNELQQLALRYNPTLIQAYANIRSVGGDAQQAGAYPNPMMGYESDTVGSSANRDYQGVYMSQWVVTANKLGLARAVANVDLMNAQLQFRRTRYEVLSQVKASYFAVLVAQRNLIVTEALVHLMNEVYRIKRSRVKLESSAYEPAQLRGLSRFIVATQLVQAQNSYKAAWKRLAARLGQPQMPPTALRGSADMPVPVLNYEATLRRVLEVHPDVIIGRNMQTRARTALKLERVRPIPDVYVYGTFQKDFTTPGVRATSYNTQIGVPLPLWNRNRGNIISAEGDLGQAQQQLRRAHMELTEQLAQTFADYETNRYQVEMLITQVLPDYARAFRGTYERHTVEPDKVGFEDVILVLQNLQDAVAVYITALSGQWAAVADLANLMQIERLEEMSAIGGAPPAPAPEPVPAPQGERQSALPGNVRPQQSQRPQRGGAR